MNTSSVDSQTLYRAQEVMGNWLRSLFSSSENKDAAETPKAPDDSGAAVQPAADNNASYEAWRELCVLESRETTATASSRWTLGKE